MSTSARILRGRPAGAAALQRLSVGELATPAERFDESAQAGYQLGYREGRAAGEATLAALADRRRSELAALERALAAAAAAADALDEARRAVAVSILDDLASAAMALTEAVVGRELRLSPEPVLDALARALAVAPDGPFVVRVHPDDAATLEGMGAPGSRASFVADPVVEPGGCILEAGATLIDAQVSSALDRARHALIGLP